MPALWKVTATNYFLFCSQRLQLPGAQSRQKMQSQASCSVSGKLYTKALKSTILSSCRTKNGRSFLVELRIPSCQQDSACNSSMEQNKYSHKFMSENVILPHCKEYYCFSLSLCNCIHGTEVLQPVRNNNKKRCPKNFLKPQILFFHRRWLQTYEVMLG